jgi:hypothetical protein
MSSRIDRSANPAEIIRTPVELWVSCAEVIDVLRTPSVCACVVNALRARTDNAGEPFVEVTVERIRVNANFVELRANATNRYWSNIEELVVSHSPSFRLFVMFT